MSKPSPIPQTAIERSRRKLLHLADRVPPLPEVVTQLLQTMDRDDCEPADIEAVLQFEPVLVSRVLMLVNSPLFALNRDITTISEAVVVLGRSPLRSMLLAYATSTVMLADYTCYGLDDRGLWFHSVATAAGAHRLGKCLKLDREAQEILFLGGLLHDTGKMLIAPTFNAKRIGTPHFPGEITDMEYQIVGLDHTEAGALVAAKWNMTDTVQEMIRNHHGHTAGPADYRLYCAVIRIANAYAHETGIGFLPGQSGEAIYHSNDLELLGLHDGSWDQTRFEMSQSIQASMAALDQLID